MNVTLSIPDDLARELSENGTAVEHRVALDLAILYYQQGLISSGKAAEMSGSTRLEFEKELAEQRIERRGSLEQLREDLEWARTKS